MPAIEQADLQAEPDLQRSRPRRSRRNTAPRSRPTRSAPCKAEKLIAAGFLEDGQSFVAFANSKGNFGYQRATNFDYTCTVRTEDGRGSGWVGRNLKDADEFNAEQRHPHRDAQGHRSAEAKALEPGKYTVILEPAAAAGLISLHDELLRRAPGRRRPQLPVEEGRRQQARRAGLRPAREHQRRPVGPGRAGAAVGRRRPAAREDGDHRERQGRATCTTRATGRRSRASAPSAEPGNLLMAGGDQVHRASWSRARRRASWSRAPGTSAWSIRRPCC